MSFEEYFDPTETLYSCSILFYPSLTWRHRPVQNGPKLSLQLLYALLCNTFIGRQLKHNKCCRQGRCSRQRITCKVEQNANIFFDCPACTIENFGLLWLRLFDGSACACISLFAPASSFEAYAYSSFHSVSLSQVTTLTHIISDY